MRPPLAQSCRSPACPLLGVERTRDFGTFRSVDDPGTDARPTSTLTQATTASTMLAADLVGTTRVRRKPALLRSDAYSGSVRSRPPNATSITISSIFPG